MKSVCKCSCVFVIAVFMLLAVSPSSAEARRWRRYNSVRVARPVYVAPVRVYAPVRANVVPANRRYRRPVRVFAPGVSVRVGGYGGVRVRVGRWGW